MCAGKDLRGIGSAQNTFSEASGLSAFLRNVRLQAPFTDKKSTLFLHLKKFSCRYDPCHAKWPVRVATCGYRAGQLGWLRNIVPGGTIRRSAISSMELTMKRRSKRGEFKHGYEGRHSTMHNAKITQTAMRQQERTGKQHHRPSVYSACATGIYLYHFTHENFARQVGEEICFQGREGHPMKNSVDLSDSPASWGHAHVSHFSPTRRHVSKRTRTHGSWCTSTRHYATWFSTRRSHGIAQFHGLPGFMSWARFSCSSTHGR